MTTEGDDESVAFPQARAELPLFPTGTEITVESLNEWRADVETAVTAASRAIFYDCIQDCSLNEQIDRLENRLDNQANSLVGDLSNLEGRLSNVEKLHVDMEALISKHKGDFDTLTTAVSELKITSREEIDLVNQDLRDLAAKSAGQDHEIAKMKSDRVHESSQLRSEISQLRSEFNRLKDVFSASTKGSESASSSTPSTKNYVAKHKQYISNVGQVKEYAKDHPWTTGIDPKIMIDSFFEQLGFGMIDLHLKRHHLELQYGELFWDEVIIKMQKYIKEHPDYETKGYAQSDDFTYFYIGKTAYQLGGSFELYYRQVIDELKNFELQGEKVFPIFKLYDQVSEHYEERENKRVDMSTFNSNQVSIGKDLLLLFRGTELISDQYEYTELATHLSSDQAGCGVLGYIIESIKHVCGVDSEGEIFNLRNQLTESLVFDISEHTVDGFMVAINQIVKRLQERDPDCDAKMWFSRMREKLKNVIVKNYYKQPGRTPKHLHGASVSKLRLHGELIDLAEILKDEDKLIKGGIKVQDSKHVIYTSEQQVAVDIQGWSGLEKKIKSIVNSSGLALSTPHPDHAPMLIGMPRTPGSARGYATMGNEADECESDSSDAALGTSDARKGRHMSNIRRNASMRRQKGSQEQYNSPSTLSPSPFNKDSIKSPVRRFGGQRADRKHPVLRKRKLLDTDRSTSPEDLLTDLFDLLESIMQKTKNHKVKNLSTMELQGLIKEVNGDAYQGRLKQSKASKTVQDKLEKKRAEVNSVFYQEMIDRVYYATEENLCNEDLSFGDVEAYFLSTYIGNNSAEDAYLATEFEESKSDLREDFHSGET